MKTLDIPSQFLVGEYYSNDKMQYALKIGNSGGIRPKLQKNGDLDYVIVITSQEDNKIIQRNPYADKIEGEILTYTGSGLKGEQKISGANKRLLEQKERPVPILGFIKEGVGKYKFIGFLFLLRNYHDYQLDREGLMRTVLIFEFLILKNIPILKVGEFNKPFRPLYQELKTNNRLDDSMALNTIENVTSEIKIEDIKKVEQLKSSLMLVDPYKFEIVVSELVTHVGFSDVKVTKKSGDDGIDVKAILKNPISKDLRYVFQVKRWRHSVGRNEVANLRGSMEFNDQGVIIATSHFTSSAIKEAESSTKSPINLLGMSDLYEVIVQSKFDIHSKL